MGSKTDENCSVWDGTFANQLLSISALDRYQYHVWMTMGPSFGGWILKSKAFGSTRVENHWFFKVCDLDWSENARFQNSSMKRGSTYNLDIILVPIDGWDGGLSIGEGLVSNGADLTTFMTILKSKWNNKHSLWSFRITLSFMTDFEHIKARCKHILTLPFIKRRIF